MKMPPDSTRADSRAFKRKWQNWQIDKSIYSLEEFTKAFKPNWQTIV